MEWIGTECRNLALYGYGTKGFMLLMVQTALELTDHRIPGEVVARILAMGQEMLAHPVHLIAGAADAVEALSDRRSARPDHQAFGMSGNARAAGLMVLDMAMFAIEDLLLKLLTQRLSVGEVLFLHGAIGAVLFAVLIRLRGHMIGWGGIRRPVVLLRVWALSSPARYPLPPPLQPGYTRPHDRP